MKISPDSITRREAIKRASLMLGAAISPSLLNGVLHAQPSAGRRGAKPAFLDAKQFALAGAIAERILPRTDTPGAADVGVPAFIDLMYGRYMTDEEKRVFEQGLAAIDSVSASQHRHAFVELPAAQQDDVLRTIAEASQAKEKTFFHLIREVTLLGYFTSEPVGKNVLHYDPIPGRFDGCIPLSEVGNKAWTGLR
jgi:gluconate 2-dehydrogenase gamma chain